MKCVFWSSWLIILNFGRKCRCKKNNFFHGCDNFFSFVWTFWQFWGNVFFFIRTNLFSFLSCSCFLHIENGYKISFLFLHFLLLSLSLTPLRVNNRKSGSEKAEKILFILYDFSPTLSLNTIDFFQCNKLSFLKVRKSWQQLRFLPCFCSSHLNVI